ncbi:hypothetical protein QM012_007923 [Aureobasidium pullulans]|uniref:Transcription factor domain-containing protein n=1 Tax=Aureobasidium pullulans TaxID=5580 RepID=A0ABR0TL60_AURPU
MQNSSGPPFSLSGSGRDSQTIDDDFCDIEVIPPVRSATTQPYGRIYSDSLLRNHVPFPDTSAISSAPHPHLTQPLPEEPILDPDFDPSLNIVELDAGVLDLNVFDDIGELSHQAANGLLSPTTHFDAAVWAMQPPPNISESLEGLPPTICGSLGHASQHNKEPLPSVSGPSSSSSMNALSNSQAESTDNSHSLLNNYSLSIDWPSIYKGYWANNCMTALHPVFNDMSNLITRVPALEDAVVALAACNLGRMSPKRRHTELVRGVPYQPHPEHWASSQQYYRSALAMTRRLKVVAAGDLQSKGLLAILILCLNLESSIGNFSGFHAHSQGIIEIIQRLAVGLDPTSPLIPLLAAWMQARYHTWWTRLYFSTFAFQLEQPTLSAPSFLEDDLKSGSTRRAMIMSILCESHRIHQKMLLGTFPLASDVSAASRPSTGSVSQWYKTGMYQELLRLQAEKLDRWEHSLPFADLPVSLEGETEFLESEGLLVNPVRFSSHHAAMNYAYYISAQLMQNAPIDLSGEHITDSDHFVILLLRIAAGISHQTCLRDNTYTIGLSSLLLAALLHTCSLDIGVWIENWLQGFHTDGQSPALEEGSFPLQQIVVVVTVINQQRRLGRNVFAISQAEDDGGGKGKADSYHSQDIKVVWLHGRERATGALFQEPVHFDL